MAQRSIEIAPATEADLPAIIEIDALTLRSRFPERIYADELARQWSKLEVLADCGVGLQPVVAAFINYWVVSDEVHLLSLATRPSHQRRGYGGILMGRLLDVASAASCRYVTLEVRRSNEAAIALYEKLGFGLVGVRGGYYADDGEDALVMVLDTRPGDSD